MKKSPRVGGGDIKLAPETLETREKRLIDSLRICMYPKSYSISATFLPKKGCQCCPTASDTADVASRQHFLLRSTKPPFLCAPRRVSIVFENVFGRWLGLGFVHSCRRMGRIKMTIVNSEL